MCRIGLAIISLTTTTGVVEASLCCLAYSYLDLSFNLISDFNYFVLKCLLCFELAFAVLPSCFLTQFKLVLQSFSAQFRV